MRSSPIVAAGENYTKRDSSLHMTGTCREKRYLLVAGLALEQTMIQRRESEKCYLYFRQYQHGYQSITLYNPIVLQQKPFSQKRMPALTAALLPYLCKAHRLESNSQQF